MRFGCYVGLEQVEAAADAGYDFAELPIAAVLPESPEAAFAPVRERLLASRIRAEAWRLHLPADLKITGPSVDWPRLARYAYTALRRAAAVGGAVVAFCSGSSRQVPNGFRESEALQQLAEFLRICGTVARGQGMVVAVEPLSASSCNLINSLPEAVSLARQVHMPEIGVLPDVSRMLREGQSLLDMVDAAEWLAHIHVPADLLTREQKARVADDVVAALRLADYDWRLSITDESEGGAAQLAASLDRLKSWFEDSDGSPP